MSPLYIGIGILAVVFVAIIMIYNGLITARMRVKEAWSDIDIQLKRRFDLIPNLINTVKGSTSFESSTLEKVIAARTRAMEAKTPGQIGEADMVLKGALSGFFALAESYPDLKSNQNFIQLQNELSDTENKIQSARRFYNSVVGDYNTKLQTVPTNLFASLFGFRESEFFELESNDQAARNPVQVSF
jgi:LemA protein